MAFLNTYNYQCLTDKFVSPKPQLALFEAHMKTTNLYIFYFPTGIFNQFLRKKLQTGQI